MTSAPISNVQRQAAFKARQRSLGRSQLTIWVDAHEREHITHWLRSGSTQGWTKQTSDSLLAVSQVERRLAALANQRGLRGEACAHALASFFEDLSLNEVLARSTREAAAMAAEMAYGVLLDTVEERENEAKSGHKLRKV